MFHLFDEISGLGTKVRASALGAHQNSTITVERADLRVADTANFVTAADADDCFPHPNPQIVVRNCTAPMPTTGTASR